MRIGTPIALALIRIGWGAVLLAVPRRVLAAVGHPQPSPAAKRTVRVLGTRHLVQGGLVLSNPSRLVIGAGAVTDVLHSLTGVALATVSPRWRFAAATDAVLAATFATLSCTQERDLT